MAISKKDAFGQNLSVYLYLENGCELKLELKNSKTHKKKMTKGTTLFGKRGQAVRKAITERTPRSAEINQKGTEMLALEVVSTLEMPYPVYIDSVSGARMTDVDGNTYIDLTMGFGPHILGHRPPVIEKALFQQIKKGWHPGLHNPLQAQLGTLIQKASPCSELTLFCNSGTEACMYAIRIARAFSAKNKIAIFDGCYHGALDSVLWNACPSSPRNHPTKEAEGRGIPAAIAEHTLMLPYRDSTAFDLIEQHHHELALIIIEPVQNSNPQTDVGDFLQELAEVCKKYGVLFMFDEVVTGFRLAYGGAQNYFGITPDLVTFGKIIGGGMPVGAVSGRAPIMSLFQKRHVFSAGTFSGNPMTMAAGIAALEYMHDHQEIYHYLQQQTDRFSREINHFCKEQKIPAQILNAGSIFRLYFQANTIHSSRDIDKQYSTAEREFDLHLMNYGVLIPGIHLAFLSTAHSPGDVEMIIEAFKQAFFEIRADGLI